MSTSLDIEMGNILEEDDGRSELEPLTSARGDTSFTPGQSAVPSTGTLALVEDPTGIERRSRLEHLVLSSSTAEVRPVDRDSASGQDFSPERRLFIALMEKNYEMVESIIEERCVRNLNVNTKDIISLYDSSEGWVFKDSFYDLNIEPSFTALHVAAAHIRRRGVELLLKAGADPNICDEDGRTVLDVVGQYYHLIDDEDNDDDLREFPTVVRLIAAAGGKQNTMHPGLNNFHVTPLHKAVLLKSADGFQALVEIGAYPGCLFLRDTPLHICVKEKFVQPFEILDEKFSKDCLSEIIDLNYENASVLYAAVCKDWLEGVQYALEFGADITRMTSCGKTPIHEAAARGDPDILSLILNDAAELNLIQYENKRGETAFFEVVRNGHTDCFTIFEDLVLRRNLLSILDLSTIRGGNVFHIVSKNGDINMFNCLFFIIANDILSSLFKTLSATGFAPIHYAVSENQIDYIKQLLSLGLNEIKLKTGPEHYRGKYSQAFYQNYNKSIVVKGSTALHIAAMYNYAEITKLLLEEESKQEYDIFDDKIITREDAKLIHEINSARELPLHTAIKYDSKDVIKILLREGSGLISYFHDPHNSLKGAVTAVELLMNYVSNPSQFLKDVFDSYISARCRCLIPGNSVEIDYTILMLDEDETNQMRVIEALLDTGNKHKQEQLLVHPLVESFLYFKWKALRPVYWVIIVLYFFFALSLSFYSYWVFYYKDNAIAWMITMYCAITLNSFQEFYAVFRQWKSDRVRDITDIEVWVKWFSIILATALSPAVALETEQQWSRHVATGALLLAWIQMMIHISRAFGLGRYVMMFGIVALNVCKILITFGALLIGFSLCFTIQFQSESPFNGTVPAFFKTMVMMTSEFDYGSLFDEERASSNLLGARVIFLVFMVLAAIVLMNLMTGVAVNDIGNLELLGNIEILKRQVRFLATIPNMLPVNWKWVRKRRNIDKVVILRTDTNFRTKHDKNLDVRIRNAIFEIVEQREKREDGKSRQPDPSDRESEIAKELKSMIELLTEVSEELKSLKSEMEEVKQLSLRNKKTLTFRESANVVLNIRKDKKQMINLQAPGEKIGNSSTIQ